MSKPILDFSKFRFRVGDTVFWSSYTCKIVGYYFSEGFNNFSICYGYVILTPNGGHDGYGFSFDEYGNKLAPNPTKNCWYVSENSVESILTNTQKNEKNGNEIKLQRTKAVISRGTVPTGYRIRSKVHKTAISIQPLSYTEIVRGS